MNSRGWSVNSILLDTMKRGQDEDSVGAQSITRII